MIAIIGGGISGLTLAYRLQQQGTPYVLLESSSRAGGYIQSDLLTHYVLEKGPNSILADEAVMHFIRELGLEQEVVSATPVSKKRYVYKNGRYRALPSGPLSLLFGSFFSWQQKISILKERNLRLPYRKDISLYDLVKERFGQEAADYALDPFVSGVYAGDPHELLADLCFPVLGKNITQYGSILKGFMQHPPKRKVSLTFRLGLGQLINQLAASLHHIRYGCEATGLKQDNGRWKLLYQTTNGQEELTCERVVLALPAYRAATLVRGFSESWYDKMSQVEYPMVRNMHLIFNKAQIGRSTEGFGALHPTKEPLFTAGIIWNTAVFSGRTPEGEVLLTCMVTEKRRPEIRNMSTEEVQHRVLEEVRQLYRIKGEPIHVQSGVWEKSIPQYTEKMRTILNDCDQLEKMNVYICSNWPHGISISDCIHRAHELAGRWKH